MVAGLKRLELLYLRVEQMRALELGLAARACAEAQEALTVQRTACVEMDWATRLALSRGERMEKRVLETTSVRLVRALPRLEQSRDAADERQQQAARAYRESRLEREQMAAVVARACAAAQADADRRAQAAMDDRFAARAVWTAASGDTESE